MIRIPYLVSLLALGFMLGCSDSSTVEVRSPDRPKNFQLTDASQASRGQLLEARRIISLSKSELDQRLAALAPLGIKPKNGVHIYKIVYQTIGIDAQSTPLQASGIVVVPDLAAPLYPWVSVQHGTIGGKIQAPSVTPSEGIVEGSLGFVAVAMDYLGYGSSSEVFRPYVIEKAYARAGVDMLKAAIQFTQQNAIRLGPLFLKGYSEGGYATMALQKALETTDKGQIPYPLVASAPSAGPYDLVLTGQQLLDSFDTQTQSYRVNPVNMPLVLLSYAEWFGGGTFNLDFFFNDTPAVKKALNGEYDTTAIYQLLPPARDLIFKPEVSTQYLGTTPAGEEMSQFKLWLQEQSLHNQDWTPSTETRLYHCEDDEEVPYEATISAYKAFQAKNPNAPVVPVVIPSPAPERPFRHANCPAIFAPLQWFGEILARAAQNKP